MMSTREKIYQALLFEILLVALLIDVIIMGLTLAYTYVFHLTYDKLRHRLTRDNTISLEPLY